MTSKTEIYFEGQHGGGCETLSNEADWTRIATYGDVPNRTPAGELVTQRFERADAEKIVAAFASNWERVKRVLGVGSGDVPVVRGHTDTGEIGEDTLADTERYGKITALEARDDGLYAQIEKAAEFASMLERAGKLEYSPTWRVRADAREKNVMRPFRLISLGMVPKGNLRGATLVNSIFNGGTEHMIEWNDEQVKRLAEVLGKEAAELGDAEAVIAAVSALAKAPEPEPTKKDEPENGDDDEAKARAKTLANAAFADETIFAAEVSAVEAMALKDYDGAAAMIAARRAKLAEKPRSATLANAAEAAKAREKAALERDAKIATLVNRRIEQIRASGGTPPRPATLWAEIEATVAA